MTRMVCTLVNTDVVVWARKNSGKSKSQLAKAVKLSDEEYNLVEAGERQLTLRQLKDLSKAVKRPYSTFYLPCPPPNVKTTHNYRSEGGTLSYQAMMSFRRAEKVQSYTNIQVDGNSALFRVQASLSSDVADLANRARAALGVTAELQARFRGSDAFRDYLVQQLQSIGIHVLFHSYPVEDSKAYTMEGNPLIVVINKRDYLTSQLFSILHEICHILLRKPGMCDERYSSAHSGIETFCNRFASNFILPTNEFLVSVSKYRKDQLTDENVIKDLAKSYSTSRDVVIFKLVECEKIDDAVARKIRAGWRAELMAKRAKGGGRTSIKANTINTNGTLFIEEVARAYAANKVGLTEASEMLGVNVSYFDDVVGVFGGSG